MEASAKSKSTSVRFCFLTMVVLLITVHSMIYAQSINGAFHGTVTNSSGAVVPQAKVEVRNLASGNVRQATTDDRGFYAITSLAPGHYSVSVSMVGFATNVQPDVELRVSEDAEVNSVLSVGKVTTVVNVTAAPPVLETASATLGSTIGSKAAVDLPLNGRQFLQLIQLSPGVVPSQGGQQGIYMISIASGTAVSPAVDGQLGNNNVYTIDGVLDNHPFIESFEISPPPDAIQEFRSQVHISDAEFGMDAGANVNVVTKSGTKEFHGDAWEFYRGRALNAANFFDNYTGSRKAAYIQNQYGATFGGPILLPFFDGRKNNTHFFGYYEGFHSAQGSTLLISVPTPAELSGNFSDLLTGKQATSSSGQPLFDALGRPIMVGQLYNPYSTRLVNGMLLRDPIPGNNINSIMPPNPGALAFLSNLYPAPNYGPGGNSFPNYVTQSNTTVVSNQFGIGVDHSFRNNDTAFAKYYYTQPNETFPIAIKYPPLENQNHAKMLSTSYTHVFSPTTVATLHYGYTWVYYAILSGTAGLAQDETINAQNFVFQVPYAPQISIGPRFANPACGSCYGLTQDLTPQGPDRMHQLNLDLQKVMGQHTLKTGVLFLHVHAYDTGENSNISFDQFPTSAISSAGTNVTSTGDGLASMLLNLPSGFNTTYGQTGADLSTFWLGGYIQDKWQATRKLNVTVGLRWDFQHPPHYAGNDFALWNLACPSTGNYTTPQAIQSAWEQCELVAKPFPAQPATPANPYPPAFLNPSQLWQPDYHGWQPRFGFAYLLTPSTVVRGGFNMFDEHNYYDKEWQAPRAQFPFGGTASATNLNRGIPTQFLNDLPSISQLSLAPTINHAEDTRDLIPYVMQWNFGIQQQLGQTISMTLDYVGSGARHQWGELSWNEPLPQNMGPNAIPNAQPFPFLPPGAAEANIFTSNYDALQFSIEKRFSHGFQFLGAYTWGQCLNEYGGDFDSHLESEYNQHLDYGGCNANEPQVFNFSPVWTLPFGRGAQFASNVNRFVDAFIGGWTLSSIIEFHSGLPFSVYLPIDNQNYGQNNGERANIVSGCSLVPAGFTQNIAHWYNPACWIIPPPYTFGDSERNGYRGPDYKDVDISLMKNFRLWERSSFQLRVEAFNSFNHTNLNGPNNTVGTPQFMTITSAKSPRQIQFGGKFSF